MIDIDNVLNIVHADLFEIIDTMAAFRAELSEFPADKQAQKKIVDDYFYMIDCNIAECLEWVINLAIERELNGINSLTKVARGFDA